MPKLISAKQKILIIEYYLIHKLSGFKSISMDLGICPRTLKNTVGQFENDGFLLLPSKMN